MTFEIIFAILAALAGLGYFFYDRAQTAKEEERLQELREKRDEKRKKAAKQKSLADAARLKELDAPIQITPAPSEKPVVVLEAKPKGDNVDWWDSPQEEIIPPAKPDFSLDPVLESAPIQEPLNISFVEDDDAAFIPETPLEQTPATYIESSPEHETVHSESENIGPSSDFEFKPETTAPITDEVDEDLSELMDISGIDDSPIPATPILEHIDETPTYTSAIIEEPAEVVAETDEETSSTPHNEEPQTHTEEQISTDDDETTSEPLNIVETSAIQEDTVATDEDFSADINLDDIKDSPALEVYDSRTGEAIQTTEIKVDFEAVNSTIPVDSSDELERLLSGQMDHAGTSQDPYGPGFNLEDLLSPIDTQTVSQASPVQPSKEEQPDRPPLVLVVDDAKVFRMRMETMLKDGGCEVLTAVDGREALDRLLSDEDPQIDMIISDIEMPRMNGFELLQRIQGNPELSHLPFAVISSNSENVQEAARLGCNFALLKPFDANDVEELVKVCLPHFFKN